MENQSAELEYLLPSSNSTSTEIPTLISPKTPYFCLRFPIIASQQIRNMLSPENWNKLTDEEERIIVRKGTEYPFTGEYNKWKEEGVFVCRRCENPLYRSSDKFDSGCGWPSFDDTFP